MNMSDRRATDLDQPKSLLEAVALQYSDPDKVPTVIAQGKGSLAQLMIELAEKHSIPVREDSEIVRRLMSCPDGSEIPEESYELVARLISFLYLVDQGWRDRHQDLAPLFKSFGGTVDSEEDEQLDSES